MKRFNFTSKIAPLQVVIIPIYKTDEQKEAVLLFIRTLEKNLKLPYEFMLMQMILKTWSQVLSFGN